MKTGLTISALAARSRAGVGTDFVSAQPLEAAQKDGMPVDIISDKQFSEMTKAIKTGAKEIRRLHRSRR